jgi:hypothetical protein
VGEAALEDHCQLGIAGREAGEHEGVRGPQVGEDAPAAVGDGVRELGLAEDQGLLAVRIAEEPEHVAVLAAARRADLAPAPDLAAVGREHGQLAAVRGGGRGVDGGVVPGRRDDGAKGQGREPAQRLRR